MQLTGSGWPLLLIAGFAAQLVLIVFVTLVGLSELSSTDQRLNTLVNQHMLRLDLTKTMHANARDRTMSLARMITLSDPFEHDEEQQQFTRYALEFGKARRQFLDLPLNEQEKKLLEQQRQLTLKAMPFQEQVIEMSSTDRHAEAQEVLTRGAIPAQNAVIQVLSQLDDLTRQGANTAIQEATAAHAAARQWILSLSILSLLLGLVIAVVVVRKIHRANQDSKHLATHDALTGLPNRVLLLDRLDQAIVHAKRNGNHVGLMFIDLDGFKAVNDKHGHLTGDELLKEIAARLKRVIRASDIVARLGGDEFIVGVLDAQTHDQIIHVAEKVLAAVAQPVICGEHTLQVSGSVGVCVFPQEGNNAADLLKCADTAMYVAKDAGKNQIYHYGNAKTA